MGRPTWLDVSAGGCEACPGRVTQKPAVSPFGVPCLPSREHLQMTSHSSSRSSGWGVVAWLPWAPCEWLNVLVSRWRR